MSLITAQHTHFGIVLAADKRLTRIHTGISEKQEKQIDRAMMTDYARKLFVTKDNFGVSYCGDSDINGVPISCTLQSLINKLPRQQSVEQTFMKFMGNLISLNPETRTSLMVAGYNKNGEATVASGGRPEFNNGKPAISPPLCLSYNGDCDAADCLIGSTEWDWGMFMLQDAIDLAGFLIYASAQIGRFSSKLQTISSGYDLVVLYPSGNYKCFDNLGINSASGTGLQPPLPLQW